MKLRAKHLATSLVMAACLAATACNQQPQPQAPPAPAPSTTTAAAQPLGTADYEVKGFRDAVVRADGESYTARRTQAHPQGISLLPRGTRAHKLEFSVQGQIERVSYYRAGTWVNLPAQSQYGFRFGAGGAFHVLIIPQVGQSATVTVTGFTDCTASANLCPTLQTPPAPH